ncbi:hypothetical protein ACFLZ1_00440 [Patescibacteria group bacterium]
MVKWLPRFFVALLFFFISFIFPAGASANRAGIHIGTEFGDFDQAAVVVGPGGWIVIIAAGTGDCETIQQMADKASAAGVNLIVRGHLGNYLTPPDALGWAATLGSINLNDKIYFMPWNEPNQAGSADWGNPADVAAYTNALHDAFAASGIGGKVALLSPMLNQTWVGGTGDFDNYVSQLRSGNGNYFNDFDGISMNLYDLSEQICGSALCAEDPHFNPAKFTDLLGIMGASGKPVYGVESGTAGESFYWKMPPSQESPLYRFVDRFLATSHPTMFAIPAYDLAGEVGHTWDLFSPPNVTNLLASEPDGSTTPASFDQSAFNSWLQSQLNSGALIECGNGCGYASAENPGLCSSTGPPTSYPPGKTDLTYCVGLDMGRDHGSEWSSPILIGETVTYRSDEEGTSPTGDENRCFDVWWTGQLQLVEDTFEMPWAYYLNEYFIGSIDIHRVPPEVLDPLQLKFRDTLHMSGPLYKTSAQEVQDMLKNDFLRETVGRIDASRAEGEALTAYISKDLSEVFAIGPWTVEEIYYDHNVYKIRQLYNACITQRPFSQCRSILAQIDEMTAAVWQLVPFYPNEKTRGKIDLSAIDMVFDPNPVKTKNPEVYRLNKISRFLRDLLQPTNKGKGSGEIPADGDVFGDGENSWVPGANGAICYDSGASDRSKESLYIPDQTITGNDYEAEVTLNFTNSTAKMGIWFRVTIDEALNSTHDQMGVMGYGYMLAKGSNDNLRAQLYKTTPPEYRLDDPTLIEEQQLGNFAPRLDFRIKVRVTGSHIETFFDHNGDGVIDEATEKVFDVNDSDFPTGVIGFKVYKAGPDKPCFSDLSISYPSQSFKWQESIPTNKLSVKIKNKVAGVFNKLIPDKIKNLLAAAKPFQPPSNLIAQADGQVPPCCFYYFGDSWGDCSCMLTNSCRGEHGCCPMHWFWGICGYTDCDCDRRSECDPNAQCTGTYFGGAPIPVGPGECETPSSKAILPDPEAIYDLKNYTPDICLYDSTVDVAGERSVKNECPYKQIEDPITGAIIEVPDTCNKTIISAINVLNHTPWLTTIREQALDISSGLFRNWNPQGLYNEDSTPFRPIPAKDQVSYGYGHTGGDPRIYTFLAQSGPWDLLFAYLGGVVKTQKWLVNKALNPLAGQVNIFPPIEPPPFTSPRPWYSPGSSSMPNPSYSPGPGASPPPPTQVSPPPIPGINPLPGDYQCANPTVSVVEDPSNRNYVFGNYAGSLLRNDSNAHSDRPYLATIVSWSDKNFRFIFSQEAGANDPFFELANGSGLRFQFYEGAHGSGELYNRFGRLIANSWTEVVQNDPLIIKWEYYDVNMEDGHRVNHAVEYYTFYPCGMVLREMKFLEKYEDEGYSFEPIEAIIMNPVGTRWFQQVQQEGEWYHTVTLQDIYSADARSHFARPTDLNESETYEEGVNIGDVENMQGKIFNFHMNQGNVFMIYGDRSGLPNDDILDVGRNWDHPCFDHGIIGWINSEWHKCDENTFNIYPNATPIIGINHQPENNPGLGQSNFTLLGVRGEGVGQTDEEIKNMARQWLEETNFGL